MSATAPRSWGSWRDIRAVKSFGHVHFVRHEDGTQGVLKSPQPGRGGTVNKTTQERFQKEVRHMQQLTQDQVLGIVPVLDTDPQDPPQWFVMPEARKLSEVLGPGGRPAELREVVEAIWHVAGTLAELAARGIAHRDIKPDNLLYYQGRPAVADFGIAAWPQLTSATHKMGPLYFLAPEMRFPDPGAPAYPADVWSLTKTLFVLAKGLKFPPDGTQYMQGQEYSLWAQGGEAATDLAPVLEAATAYEQDDRLTMPAFRDELAAWLELHPEPVTPAHPAVRRGFRALEAATADVRRHEAELRRLLPAQLRRLATTQHGESDRWLTPALGERHPENVRLIDSHGYPDDPDDPEYDMGVDGMVLSSTVPDAAGRRLVLGGFLMGTVTTLAAEIQQDGEGLASWSKDVNALLPSARVALWRITDEMQAAYAELP
ncbi:protein kinase domain-containing protein [Streptomyces sp. NPDC003314]